MHRAVAPIPDLFLGSFHLLWSKRVPVFVAIVSFAMLMALTSAVTNRKVSAIEEKMAADNQMTFDAFRDQVAKELGELSSMELTQFVATVEGPAGRDALGMAYIRTVGPVLFLQLGINITVLFIASVFFLMLATGGTQSAYEVSRALPLMIVRMCGLLIWMLVRSLLWIPLIGLFIAIYMLPRLSLAPVILASGEAGIFESLHMSMRRTSGKWLSLFLRLLFIALVAFLLLWPMVVMVAITALFSVKIAFILWLMALILIIAFFCAAMTVLTAMLA